MKKKLYLNLIEQHILHAADEIHVGKYKQENLNKTIKLHYIYVNKDM